MTIINCDETLVSAEMKAPEAQTAMSFPDSPRVIYRKNPLVDVTCLVRFPPILKIDSQAPAAFQDAIRSEYPTYREVPIPDTPIPANVPEEVIRFAQGLGVGRRVGTRYEFISEDDKWAVILTRESLGLKTREYRRWEQFQSRFEKVIAAFMTSYQPAFFVRVGLEYIDVIRRSVLGLSNEPWAHLLKPHIAGELSAMEIANGIDSASRQAHIRLETDDSHVTLKSGLVLADDKKEKCFVIDMDFHTHSKTEKSDVLGTLKAFNRLAGRLFRWCIHQRLHEALEPSPAE